MKLLERILVAVDFGPATEHLVDSAADLAGVFHSQLQLIHVLPPATDGSPTQRQLHEMAVEGASARLCQAAESLENRGFDCPVPLVVDGVPFDRIIDQADHFDVNVVMLSANSASHSADTRLGTTAERVMRKANKPVWIVKPGQSVRPDSILCPVDNSKPSRRALSNAIHLARHFGARLTVLHVVTPMSNLSVLFSKVDPSVQADYRAGTLAQFDRFLRDFDFHGVNWEKSIREGDPADEILAAREEAGTPLIVMGSVGKTDLSRILLGSVAGKVARTTEASLILFKAEDAVRLRLDQELVDLQQHLAQAQELLDKGFADDARREFLACVRANDMFLPAWEGLAEAYRRAGEMEKAEQCHQTCQRIEEALDWRKVEAEIRRQHPLWSKGAP